VVIVRGRRKESAYARSHVAVWRPFQRIPFRFENEREWPGILGGGSSAAQQEDYVEQDKDCYHHFQGEHAALVELSDHEFVQLAGRF
jgi:hypothetical protein